MWNAIVAGVVFQHESIELLQRELSRNPSLLQACGFNVLPLQKKPVAQLVKNELTGRMEVVWPQPEAPHYAVPNSWNFSRFLSNLIEVETEQGLLSRMLIDLREQLMAVLPDFGQHLGYDGKAIDSHSTGQVDSKSGESLFLRKLFWASLPNKRQKLRDRQCLRRPQPSCFTRCIPNKGYAT